MIKKRLNQEAFFYYAVSNNPISNPYLFKAASQKSTIMDEYKNLNLVKELKSCKIYTSPLHEAVIICASSTYITIEDFKSALEEALQIIKANSIKKTVFDKRALKVFHQPSMQWYFTDWKERLYNLGVVKHIKILPDDFVFRSSVKIGRAQIDEQFPNALYHKTQIIYKDTLLQALEA
jgi:hypothetical protein